jgi:glycyl-tRNA synthetase
MKNEFLEKFINFLKNEGFIFQSNEIYGGVSGFYDFGPLGSLMKLNIKNLWLKDVVFSEKNVFLIDTSLINPKVVFEASGHLENFFDILIECKNCHLRFKKEEGEKCPDCGSSNLTKPRKFNLMFQTKIGSTGKIDGFLRPETAQGVFVNFLNVLNSTRTKLPFGIANIGKSFRNEINPRNFIFRLREFEQMELEFFTKPQEADFWFNYWLEKRYNWYLSLGIKKENIKKVEIPKSELPHYSKRNVDLHYNFPFGFQEIEGLANRGDYDLKRHSEFSGKSLTYYDQKEKESYFPYVIEPSAGIERLVFAFLVDAFDEDEVDGKKRFVLRLNPKIAPIKFAVLPLLSNRKEIVRLAQDIYDNLRKEFICVYDENGSIGRRYRRQDEIGTPWCITVDFESLEKKDVTVRDRDSTKQERIKIEELEEFFLNKLK